MAKFVIQTINGHIVHDFSFILARAIEYKNNLDENFEAIFSEEPSTDDKSVPVGSVEFVCKFLKTHYNLIPKPLNIPDPLLEFEFTKRQVFIGTEKDVTHDIFFKSHDRIKGYSINEPVLDPVEQCPPGRYLVSEMVDIESEWRTFVFKDELVGLQNYIGNCTVFPDVNEIQKMIVSFDGVPIAYTLDVGAGPSGTFILEAHDFFSCGLYGFANYNILPAMFSSWMYQYINQNKKRGLADSMARRKNKDPLAVSSDQTVMQTIGEYLDEKQALGLLSESSVDNRRIELDRFRRFCEGAGIFYPDEIHKKLIVRYMKSLSVANSTKNTIKQILSAYMDYLVEEGIVLENILATIKSPKVHPPSIDILTPEEVEQLFAAEQKKNSKVTDRNLLIYSLLLDLCLRASEISGITMDDLKISNGANALFLVRKGGKQIKLPLNEHLVGLFVSWLGIRETYSHSGSDNLFITNRSGRLDRKQVYSIVNVGFSQAGIKKKHSGPHTLRHTGASRMGEEGINPKIIQFLLGHSSMNTTTRYLHFLEKELVKALDRKRGWSSTGSQTF